MTLRGLAPEGRQLLQCMDAQTPGEPSLWPAPTEWIVIHGLSCGMTVSPLSYPDLLGDLAEHGYLEQRGGWWHRCPKEIK